VNFLNNIPVGSTVPGTKIKHEIYSLGGESGCKSRQVQHVDQLSISVTKYLTQSTYKEKCFILAYSFKVSAYDKLALLLWASGKAAHHGRTKPLTS
jgi:hypothetical protein